MDYRRLPQLALVLATALAAVGCSADRQIIHSTAAHPRTATIVDTTTAQALWSMDIPVAHTLVLDGEHPHDVTFLQVGNTPATSMTWKLYETAQVETSAADSNNYAFRSPIDTGVIELPGNVVRIDVTPSVVEADTTAPPVVEVERQMEESADAAEPLDSADGESP